MLVLRFICIVVFIATVGPLQWAWLRRERDGHFRGEWDFLLFPVLHFVAMLGMILPVVLAFTVKMPVGFVLAAMVVLLFAGTAVLASFTGPGDTILWRTMMACRYPLAAFICIDGLALPLCLPESMRLVVLICYVGFVVVILGGVFLAALLESIRK